MTRTVTATELKATLLAVLDDVARGDEIEITKRGRPVARLVPVTSPSALKGRFTGIAATSAADDDLFTTDSAWSAG